MGREQFSFEGIEHIEAAIRRRAEDASYVAVWDRTERKTEEPAGRFELSVTDALPFLTDQPALPPLADDDDEPDDDDDGGEGEEPEDDEEPSIEQALAKAAGPNLGSEIGVPQIAEAACRWLRDLAVRYTFAEPFRRFRVRICGPKGYKTVDGGTFLCRNHGFRLEAVEEEEEAREVVAKLQIPQPSFEQAANEGGAKAMKVLGDLYAQWGKIVIGSVGQLQGVNNAMNAQLHRQLHDSRGQVDTLVAAILEHRYKQAVADDKRDQDERAGDTRASLARDAINQLGEAARAFLLSRGLTPDTAEILGVLGNSPELAAALNDPDVRALLDNPDNLRGLATMLRQFGAQARAAAQATQAQGGQAQRQPPPAPGFPPDPTQPAAE
ncbi:MAG: hypothetical protein ABIO70_29905 [Pseudomonadota bacterium]